VTGVALGTEDDQGGRVVFGGGHPADSGRVGVATGRA
jgi:hypothetical protein